MKAFWEGLSARERLLFQVAGGLAAALLFSLVILRPFNEWQAAQRKALQRAEGLYEIVVEAAAFSGNKSIEDAGTGPIRNAVTATASSLGVELVFVNVRPDGAVEANAAPSQPSRLFQWLDILSRDHGFEITYADLVRDQSDQSLVRGRLILARKGAGRSQDRGGGR